MVSESITLFLEGVAQLLTSLVALATFLGLLDRFIGGRMRSVLQVWLGIAELQEASDRHDRKLDILHGDHLISIGIQNDQATAHNNLTRNLVNEQVINDGGEDLFMATEDIRQHAQEAGAEWPGSFLRGGTSYLDQDYSDSNE